MTSVNHEILGLIDKNSQNIPENDYLQLMNLLKLKNTEDDVVHVTIRCILIVSYISLVCSLSDGEPSLEPSIHKFNTTYKTTLTTKTLELIEDMIDPNAHINDEWYAVKQRIIKEKNFIVPNELFFSFSTENLYDMDIDELVTDGHVSRKPEQEIIIMSVDRV